MTVSVGLEGTDGIDIFGVFASGFTLGAGTVIAILLLAKYVFERRF